MECHPARKSDCEHCVLCSISNRVHSFKHSGQAFLGRVRQKGKIGVAYVVEGISERSRRFEEAHPQTSEILGSSKRKILSVGVVVLGKSKTVYHKGVTGAKHAYTYMRSASLPSSRRVKRFLKQNTIICYFVGGLMLTAGTFFYAIPVGAVSSSSLFLCSIWFILVGGFLVWVPVIYWWRLSSRQNRLVESRIQAQLNDKPPSYENLLLASLEEEAPPAYEDILAWSQDLGNSSCGFVAAPLCAVHQPTECLLTTDAPNLIDINDIPTVQVSSCAPCEITDIPTVQVSSCAPCEITPVQSAQIRRDFTTLQKSRSTTDLCDVRLELHDGNSAMGIVQCT